MRAREFANIDEGWKSALGGAALGAALATGMQSGHDNYPRPIKEPMTSQNAPMADLTPPQKKVDPSEKWSYQTHTDEMSGKTSVIASETSKNSVSLESPYYATRGHLDVMYSPPMDTNGIPSLADNESFKEGHFILFRVDSGQINAKDVRVKFDNNPPISVSVSDYRRDGDWKSIAISHFNEPQFANQLSGAKTMKIEVPFYRDGVRIFEFDVSGIDLGKLK